MLSKTAIRCSYKANSIRNNCDVIKPWKSFKESMHTIFSVSNQYYSKLVALEISKYQSKYYIDYDMLSVTCTTDVNTSCISHYFSRNKTLYREIM